MALWLPMALPAWEPNANDLEAAINAGDFAGYHASISSWLNQKVPAEKDRITDEALKALLKDPAIANVLAQRQLMAKVGLATLGAFAKGGPDNKTFLAWLLRNTAAMDMYVEAATPTGLVAREEDKWTLPIASLEIWKELYLADAESREGAYLRLAIATAIAPPGSVNIGAGGAATPADPVVRYTYFKTAHKNKMLFPSFDNLSVWEYSKVVVSGASDSDLTWAREMINTFRPDLRAGEMVVNSTSFVWRRGAPAPFWKEGVGYDNSFKNVLAGGGKCGPRSSWAVMVCHAFGIPAIGVGQPAHACVAWRSVDGTWKVGYGGGWNVSKLDGLKGPDFVAGVEARARLSEFSLVEHLRWLASALASKDQAGAVMGIARKIAQAKPATTTDLTASQKAEEAEADPGAAAKSRFGQSKTQAAPNAPVKPEPSSKPDAPVPAAAGVIHVEAVPFAKTGGEISWGGQFPNVLVHDCFTGGKQVYFQQQMKRQWADYSVDVPAAGTYELTMKAACVNSEQVLEVSSGDKKLAAVDIPLSYGLWTLTKPADVKLEKGPQTIRVETPTTEHKRGIALRWFELRLKE
jgi:hypothetical protein